MAVKNIKRQQMVAVTCLVTILLNHKIYSRKRHYSNLQSKRAGRNNNGRITVRRKVAVINKLTDIIDFKAIKITLKILLKQSNTIQTGQQILL